MTGLEMLQSVQYVTVGDRRLAVVEADDWEAMVEWLETLEDVEIAKEAFAALKAAGGDRERAGWLRWDDIKGGLNSAGTPSMSSPPLEMLPPLDAHAHLDPARSADELTGSGAVLAMTLSLDEAALAVGRREPHIAWGVGCHPRKPRAQESFNPGRFRELAERAALVGEIGLDTGSRVPLEVQLRTFRQALEVVADLPRLVSIHSYRATGLVLEELGRRPVAVPVLHWWTGSAQETREAVALGCYFSIHSAVARHSKFRTAVPPERVLVESDHGYADPPAAIPCRIEWVEYLVAQQLGLDVQDVRRLAWQNLGTIVRKTGTLGLLPEPLAALLAEVSPDVDRRTPCAG